MPIHVVKISENIHPATILASFFICRRFHSSSTESYPAGASNASNPPYPSMNIKGSLVCWSWGTWRLVPNLRSKTLLESSWECQKHSQCFSMGIVVKVLWHLVSGQVEVRLVWWGNWPYGRSVLLALGPVRIKPWTEFVMCIQVLSISNHWGGSSIGYFNIWYLRVEASQFLTDYLANC